jgi:hypothetical protein
MLLNGLMLKPQTCKGLVWEPSCVVSLQDLATELSMESTRLRLTLFSSLLLLQRNQVIDRWSQLVLHPKFLESLQLLMVGDGGVKFFSPNEGVHIGISGT